MGMDKFSLGKMLAERLGITRDTRPGRIMWPMNAQAKAEQERHSAVRHTQDDQILIRLINGGNERDAVDRGLRVIECDG